MTQLHHEHIVACPYDTARRFLRERLEGFALAGHIDRIELEAGTLRKEVDVRYTRANDPMHFDEPWSVHWEPHGGGPFPQFDGSLTVRADETYSSSILELSGTYEPPFGFAGAAFDEVVGKHVAELTARALLKSIGESMELRYAEEEALKASARAKEEQ
jgi:hypothetical protein